ncbi:MAG: YigZ family protein [Bacteroidota bacterium]
MSDEFKTILGESKAETRVQASRFIATASPILTKEEAEAFIGHIRKSLRDATHHCYAYRLGTDERQFRFNDDGEPNGSAGKPILAAIDKFNLTDTLVVVTRYFGGTKLGVGGLVRAYGESSEAVLSTARVVTKYRTGIVRASFPHSRISNVMHVIAKLDARIVDTLYDEEVHLDIEIRNSRSDELKSALVEQTSGNVRLKTKENDT